MRCGSVTVDVEKKSICGGGTYFGNWSGKDWNMYFAMEFDTDFTEIGVFEGENIIRNIDGLGLYKDMSSSTGGNAYVKAASVGSNIFLHIRTSFSRILFLIIIPNIGINARISSNFPAAAKEIQGRDVPWPCVFVFYSSKRHTAWQAMPSPLPVKPRCSSVVAFTFTRFS